MKLRRPSQALYLPPDVLVVETVTADVDDCDHGDTQLAATGWHAGEEPVDHAVVGAAVDELVHDAVRTYRARHGGELCGVRVAKDKMVAVELEERLSANSASHSWDVVDVGFSLDVSMLCATISCRSCALRPARTYCMQPVTAAVMTSRSDQGGMRKA